VGTEVQYELKEGGFSVRTPVGAVDRLQLGLVGERQPHNAAVAIASIHAAGVVIDADAIRDGVRHTSLPGRMERREWRGREVILDGAHNGEAAETLARTLAGRRFSVVAGMVSGHDAARVFKQIAGIADAVFLSPIDFHRARNPIELAAELQGIVNVVALDSVGEALQAAHATGLPILVMGSFYLVGEAGRWMATNP
jgi:dihydrofolate synthase/folylpolyglutamate synthase